MGGGVRAVPAGDSSAGLARSRRTSTGLGAARAAALCDELPRSWRTSPDLAQAGEKARLELVLAEGNLKMFHEMKELLEVQRKVGLEETNPSRCP